MHTLLNTDPIPSPSSLLGFLLFRIGIGTANLMPAGCPSQPQGSVHCMYLGQAQEGQFKTLRTDVLSYAMHAYQKACRPVRNHLQDNGPSSGKAGYSKQALNSSPADSMTSASTGFNCVSQELPIMALGAKGLFTPRVPRSNRLGSPGEGLDVDHPLWAALSAEHRSGGYSLPSHSICPNSRAGGS